MLERLSIIEGSLARLEHGIGAADATAAPIERSMDLAVWEAALLSTAKAARLQALRRFGSKLTRIEHLVEPS